MNIDAAAAVVRCYYAAFRAGDAEKVAEALAGVLAPSFVLDSPLIRDRFAAPVPGPLASAMAVQAASMLQHVTIEALHFAADSPGVVALIQFPTRAGAVWQSEYFDLEPVTLKVTRLRSFYDPRVLLSL